ncbi:hypothetical protein [Kitasatospora sp. NPDC093102]
MIISGSPSALLLLVGVGVLFDQPLLIPPSADGALVTGCPLSY